MANETHPIFQQIFDSFGMTTRAPRNRRERLIRFIENAGMDYTRIFFTRNGAPAFALVVDDLTDAALERFAQRLRRDFWSRRRMNRENRALRAASFKQAAE